MSTRLGIGGSVLILIVAVAVNPRPQQYQRYVYRKLCQQTQLQSLEAQLTCNGLRILPAEAREAILGQYVTRHNYGVFSLYVLDMPTLYDESLGLVGGFIDRQAIEAETSEGVARTM